MTEMIGPLPAPAVVVIGGGLHAAVVVDCIRASGQACLAGYTDDPAHEATHMGRLAVTYLGDDDQLVEVVRTERIAAGVLGLAGHTHAKRRREIVDRLSEVLPGWWTAIHPRATVAGSARIDDGTVVFAGAVINALAQIGRHAVINTGAVVEHHCLVDDFAVISPHATLCGCVHVGEGAFIGAGATVITGVRIGARSVIGAGAIVLKDVPEGVVVVGNPARIVERCEQDSPLALAAVP